ncbi:hypothetical protein [Geothrix sp. SG200]|uniref:hypothetical protein n=1 Tax=Geothrix sp. SG200 TaxID=2922865 RepID=UPI001FAC75C0|nr:hypothetical protein [Geothrix sp. SG200]
MSAARPEDQPIHAALRGLVENWVNQKNQSLLEEVIATWQLAMDRFHPDDALIEKLRQAIPAQASAETDGGGTMGSMAAFSSALDLVEGAPSQSDLLKRLLDGLDPLVERSALFIVKQGLASLYAHRGFEAGAPLKPGAVVPPPDLESVIQGLGRSLRKKGAGYSALVSVLSSFEAADLVVLPLRHKRKTVALLLVDSGLRQKIDHPELVRALVLAASAALGGLAAGKDEAAHALPPPPPAGLPPSAPPPSAPPSSELPPASPQPLPPLPSSHSSAPTQMVPEPIEAPAALDLDPKTRAAAERLARVLVGDVELYFPTKVAQAQTHGNLYGLLREELERSRATFVERFGEDVEAHHRIFTSTVVNQLCEGDASKLGPAPWA